MDPADFMCSGNLFHTSGAARDKDLSPNVFKFFRGTSRIYFCEKQRYLRVRGLNTVMSLLRYDGDELSEL